ncbi:MAG TPA: hypothetical protein VFU12_16970 [Glycomyces sp.]|nr:hypothetical protein [Glycomyces sp.]
MTTPFKRLGRAVAAAATPLKRTAAVALAVIVGAVVLAAGGPAAADEITVAPSDEITASAGTPDNTTFHVYRNGAPFASVMWNDYADDDHGRDLDDFHICDTGADGLAPYFQAVYGGEVYSERIDGGKGNCEVQGVGNVSPVGSHVDFRVCVMNGQNVIGCAPWIRVYE